MLIVGLTGGIASGKTAASDAFARLGAPVIDTDVLARELVMPGQPALLEIARRFGPESLTEAGELDRRKVRERVFADPELRDALEAILHPRIRQATQRRLALLDAAYCIVVIPLLVEKSGMLDLVQRVLVVDAPLALQVQRLMARDGSDETQARAIIAAQASRDERLAIADDVIENTGDIALLATAVEALHEKYQRLAS